MSGRPRMWAADTAPRRACPTCDAKPEEPCTTPSGKRYRGHVRVATGERVPWHHMRCVIDKSLTRYAVTTAGTGHVRDAIGESEALCGTAVTYTDVFHVYLRCKECRGLFEYAKVHPDSPIAKRILPDPPPPWG